MTERASAGPNLSNSANKCNSRWKLGLLKESKFGNRALSVLWYLFIYFSYSAARCGDVVHLEAMMIAWERFIVFLIMACDRKSFWLLSNLTREMGKSTVISVRHVSDFCFPPYL